jgi:hypothetical protein
MVKAQGNEALRDQLRHLSRIEDPLRRRLVVTGVVTKALQAKGVTPVLVGGLAIDFYTYGGYGTVDIDLVAGNRETIQEVLAALGFERPYGDRNWYLRDEGIVLEVPDSVLAGSPERVLEVEVNGLPVHVIGLEDLILDRVEGYVGADLRSDFDWAVNLAAARYETLDTAYLLAEAERRQVRPAAEKALAEAKRRLEALGDLGSSPPPSS